MDPDSGAGERSRKRNTLISDDFDNAKESEEVPKISSPEIHDVFHVFARMLDIKSFMKLAMTSKEMYKRCMEDKKIEINIREKRCAVELVNGRRRFYFESYDVSTKNNNKYFEKLRQLNCNVSLHSFYFGVQTDTDTLRETRGYLEELGVRKINNVDFNGEFTDWHDITFLKDFDVKNVELSCRLPDDDDDLLHSFLKLKLDYFYYYAWVDVEALLRLDSSPVKKIEIYFMEMDEEDFLQILWKIQTGAFNTLSLNFGEVPWEEFTKISTYHEGVLPEDRPLLIMDFEGRPRDFEEDPTNGWFLHWNGAVTKIFGNSRRMEFSKGDSEDLPAVLRSKEYVHKALAEKRELDCLKSHFTSFFDGIPLIEESHEGPLPDERPLIFKAENEVDGWLRHFILNEDGAVEVFYWDSEGWSLEEFDLEKDLPPVGRENFSLLKYLFKRRIEKPVRNGSFLLEEVPYFPSLFDDFEAFPHDFRGVLPDNRPLIFESALIDGQTNSRTFLYEDGSVVQYSRDRDTVHIRPCPSWNLPSILITPDHLTNIIHEASMKMFTYKIDLDVFRAAQIFNASSIISFNDPPIERPVLFKNIEGRGIEVVDTRWIILEDGDVKRCEWKDGRATIASGAPRVPAHSGEVPDHGVLQGKKGQYKTWFVHR